MFLKSYSSQPEVVESHLVTRKSKSLREALIQRNLLHPFIQDTTCSLRSSPDSAILRHEQTLQSFCKLVSLLHPNDFTPALRSCIVHFLRQLKSLLPDENADPREVEITIQAHDVFIRAIDLSNLENDHLLTLTIQLKLLINANEALVVAVFSYLIVENGKTLEGKILDIAFAKTCRPAFAAINTAIEKAQQAHGPQNDQIARIERYSDLSVKIDEDEARGFILSIMHMFIVDNISKAFKNGRVELWACKVINNLLIIAKTASDRVLVSVASCLGLFGAIDPLRFAVLPGSVEVKKATVYAIETSTEEFKEQLLRDLAEKCLSASGSSKMIYECTLKETYLALNMKEKDRAFLRLNEDLKSLCRAVLVSPFKADPVCLRGDKTLPIFQVNSSYSNWICSWVDEMISDFKPDTHNGSLFLALRPIFIQDVSFLEKMLPSVIFSYLSASKITDVRKNQVVRSEIEKVISSALPQGQLSTFDFSSAVDGQISVTGGVLTRTQLMASQRIFSLFDTFTAWLKSTNMEKSRSDSIFTYLFGSIDKCSMAYLAYGCKAYTRSLKYLEEYLHHSPDGKLSSVCSTLFQQIYLALDDPDGAIGAKSQRFELRDKILAHEAHNDNQYAFTCCDKGLHSHPGSLEYHKKVIRCLMSLGTLSSAMLSAEGTIKKRPEWHEKISPYMATCAWQLGDWDSLEQVISQNEKSPVDKSNMSLNIGRLINCAVSNRGEQFPQLLKSITVRAMRPISVAVSEKLPYDLCYPHLVRIQELNEIRMACSILHNIHPELDFEDLDPMWLRQFWQSRNRYLPPNLKVLGVMLTLQKALFSLNRTDSGQFTMDIANCLLQTAKLARKLGHEKRAYMSLLHLEEMIPRLAKDLPFVASYIIERAKYEWNTGNDFSRESAIQVLEDGIKDYFKDLTHLSQERPSSRLNDSRGSKEPPEHRQAFYKILLLKAKLSEESGLQATSNIISMYSAMNFEVTRCEKGAVQLAKLYDKLCTSEKGMAVDPKRTCDYMCLAIEYYCSTLRLGCKYIYEALPRLLQMWFDMGSLASHYDKVRSKSGKSSRPRDFVQQGKEVSENFYRACGQVESLRTYVSMSTLYTALSQMLTRIDHSHKKVQDVLDVLVVSVLQRYPQQASWYLFSNLRNKLSHALIHACERILNKAAKNDPKLREFFVLMRDAADQFAQLINAPHTKTKSMTMTELKVGLQRFIKKHPNTILMPCHKFLTASITSKRSEPQMSAPPDTPFADVVTISEAMNDIYIFESLAKPKKFILRGSDGKKYPFLAKPQDDLRRDSRTVEYLELFNRLMQKDPETRKRNLKIVVFAVIPFGAESGLIEFIEGLTDIRSILLEEYKNTKSLRSLEKHSSWMKHIKHRHPGNANASDETVARNYRDYLREFCQPPVFWNWFLRTYTHPSEWHAAKLIFTRSLAVMSIVGYIIGLGDRHLENILIEKATGRIVHVDYNCIFNQGENLQTPERVPFRLTHNLIDAMGSICYEGHFKRTCEEVLRVARNNSAPIMSVLKAFAFDPLVGANCTSIKTQQQAGRDSRVGAGDTSRMIEDAACTTKVSIEDIVENIEICNKQASNSIKLIDERLRGLHRSSCSSSTDEHTRPLSVKGQVNALIKEATDDTRLARMYYGWAPFL